MTIKLSILLGGCALFGASFLALEQIVDDAFLKSMRLLISNKPSFIIEDGRNICDGPQRTFDKYVDPYYVKAHYALHVGHSASNGELSDNIIIMFNAYDNAMTSGNQTVVVVEGWAEEFLNIFFPDDETWSRASRDLPIVRKKDAEALELKSMRHTSLAMFIRGADALKEQVSWDETHQRRLKFIHYLFSSLAGKPCNEMHKIIGFANGKYTSRKYVAVSLRHIPGGCERFNHFHHEQCSMEASYIKSILEPLGAYGKLPIVLLGHNVDAPRMKALRVVLPNVVVPQLDLGGSLPILTYMAIGGMSDIFIGNEGCSVSRNIGVIREAFGKDPETNYVFIETTAEGLVKSVRPEYPYTFKTEDVDGTGVWP